jgi:predicted ATPase
MEEIAMARDRLTELRIKNMRTLADVRLALDGLTVLIGDNGTGKSSILEACELLRRASTPAFGNEIHTIHGGPASLLRAGATELTLGVRVEGDGEPLDYEFSMDRSGHFAREKLLSFEGPGPSVVFERAGTIARFSPEKPDKQDRMAPDQLALSAFGIRPPDPAMLRLMKALERIEVHVPFELTPLWVARSTQRPSALRSSSLHQPVDRLSKLGANLANAFSSLKNDFAEGHWQETMAYVRLGLGDGVESVNVRPDPGGGAIALWLKHTGLDQQLPSSALSDGTLAYLALVALYRLDTGSTLVAFDEPELHLHPALLMRALDFFEAMARVRPVILATHSDRLLDGLTDPAHSTVLCELDEERRTRLVRPDPEALERWLARYRGLGDIRSAGHEASVMSRDGAS